MFPCITPSCLLSCLELGELSIKVQTVPENISKWILFFPGTVTVSQPFYPPQSRDDVEYPMLDSSFCSLLVRGVDIELA